MNKQQKFLLAASAAGAVSTFLPWISVSAGAFGYSMSESRNGLHGMGVLYFIVMAAVAIAILMANQLGPFQKNLRIIVMAAGALCALLAVISYSNASGEIGGGYGVVKASMGVGLILAFLAAAALVAIPLAMKQAGENLADDFAGLKNSVKAIQLNMPKPSQPAAPAKQGRMEELEKLIEWRNKGQITQEEFEALKSKII